MSVRKDRPEKVSRINRDGLSSGTVAQDFRLRRLDNEEYLSLESFRGRRVLIVFSDPQCGPCNQLAPRLERLSKRTPDIQVVMISRGDVESNRLKVAEFGLTFPVVLQRKWEISLLYGIFATPVAYNVNQDGVIDGNIAIGTEQILSLLKAAAISSLLNDPVN